MISYLLISSEFDSRLRRLRGAGKKAALAAEQADAVLELLVDGRFDADFLVGKRTKYGEQRLAHCMKYDLGCGYRLITVRVGDRLYIPFIGGHDDCDLWLERHRGKSFTPQRQQYRAVAARTDTPRERVATPSEVFFDDDEPLEAISDADALAVFAGLCANGHERSQRAATR
ncbi:MAG: hypothetical protein LBU39_06935 [Desulfobulbaceae bacterium]|jgi:hypothetical protein|nr:hypothetical protein [Desulfobulbaceae bacterium]